MLISNRDLQFWAS